LCLGLEEEVDSRLDTEVDSKNCGNIESRVASNVDSKNDGNIDNRWTVMLTVRMMLILTVM
jgi:hypothetical protein